METKTENANQSQLVDSQNANETRKISFSEKGCLKGNFILDQSQLVESRDADQSKGLPSSIKIAIEIKLI